MRIEADGYAYDCDFDVEIGDTVLVKVSAEWSDVLGRTAKRTVTALESDYTGHCQKVLEKLDD